MWIKWSQSDTGNYRDDYRKLYQVTVISDLEYNRLDEADRSGFQKHWSGSRFVELAGLTPV